MRSMPPFTLFGKDDAVYPRTNYEMTPDDLEGILDACSSVPMIMLQCGPTRNAQERANDAWAELGKRMGFDPMTVLPTDRGDRFFTAVPSENEQHRKDRLLREEEEKAREKVKRIEAEIETLQNELAAATSASPSYRTVVCEKCKGDGP